ncbi:MAG: nucleotidyl transferase AbiEii/AbiGii toxin family protein [Candidatus Brocadiia bacterium]
MFGDAGTNREPQRPTHLSRFAQKSLEALEDAGLAGCISVGGGLGLLHYLDYRTTHDVDAWWTPEATEEAMRGVVACVRGTLEEDGEVDVNRWGEVTSLELKKEGDTVFSFQIARRSAQLSESVRADWVHVPVDSLDDILASKMVALVERGAPRDFRDIYTACTAGLTTAEKCWKLWQERQKRSGSDTDMQRARLAVETHLERIAIQRPLDGIEDDDARAEAATTREWFREVLVKNGQ